MTPADWLAVSMTMSVTCTARIVHDCFLINGQHRPRMTLGTTADTECIQLSVDESCTRM